ncbi:hypothetical protein Barb7_00645 [Bacteroidales bacterium Barb7]|nr:hypothetical protein Barb7_00645 [Bacteroidales bacterium Barb7]
MRKTLLLIIYTLLPLCMVAQQDAEYNKRGEEAMQRKDYSDARMYFSEGLEHCDMYSVQGLTRIWLLNESIRSSMRSLMAKCQTCLNERAVQNDTTAMSRLIVYYSEGIAGPKTEGLIAYWTDKLEASRHLAAVQKETAEQSAEVSAAVKSPQINLSFLAGLAGSPETPYGLTLGVLWQDKAGGYVRGKTSLSSVEYTHEIGLQADDIKKSLPDGQALQTTGNPPKKVNGFTASAGFVYKPLPWLYVSLGAGYGERTLMYQFAFIDKKTSEQTPVWCKIAEASYTGAVIEADGMVKYKRLFLSVGCHTINVKYVDLNAGIGVIF